jgi:hypothetical protein
VQSLLLFSLSRESFDAMLVRAGFVVVPVPVNVYGFRPVLARGWHEATS